MNCQRAGRQALDIVLIIYSEKYQRIVSGNENENLLFITFHPSGNTYLQVVNLSVCQ